MSKKQEKGTLSALLEDKPKRGRPPRALSRQNVYVALSDRQKRQITELADALPAGFSRADVPDLAVTVMGARFEALRLATAGRTRDIPEGVTDLQSLYLLWDVERIVDSPEPRWTSIRLSQQQAMELGRIQGALNMRFGSNRSEVFSLALALLQRFVTYDLPQQAYGSLSELREEITRIYL